MRLDTSLIQILLFFISGAARRYRNVLVQETGRGGATSNPLGNSGSVWTVLGQSIPVSPFLCVVLEG